MGRVRFEQVATKTIPYNYNVSVMRLGKRFKVVSCNKYKNPCSNIRKLPNGRYLDKTTNKEFKAVPKENRDIASIRRSLNKANNYIEHNFTGADNELLIGLTYAEEVRDIKLVKKNYKAFRRKLCDKYVGLESICIFELHDSRVWHMHILVKGSTSIKLNISKYDIQKIWPHGTEVYVGKIRNIDALRIYLTVPTGEKLERIKDIPKDFNLYSKSKGIEKPPKYSMNYGQFRRIYNVELQEAYTLNIIDIEEDYVITPYTVEIYKEITASVTEPATTPPPHTNMNRFSLKYKVIKTIDMIVLFFLNERQLYKFLGVFLN